jgi:hypothetical protein
LALSLASAGLQNAWIGSRCTVASQLQWSSPMMNDKSLYTLETIDLQAVTGGLCGNAGGYTITNNSGRSLQVSPVDPNSIEWRNAPVLHQGTSMVVPDGQFTTNVTDYFGNGTSIPPHLPSGGTAVVESKAGWPGLQINWIP